MPTLPPPTMLGSNGAGKEAYEKWHEAIRRISGDKRTLGTKYASESEESSQPPEWLDEIDEARRKDSNLGRIAIAFILFTAAAGWVLFSVNR